MDRLFIVKSHTNIANRWLFMIQVKIMVILLYSESYFDMFRGGGVFIRTRCSATTRFSWSRKASTSWRKLCSQSEMSRHRTQSIRQCWVSPRDYKHVLKLVVDSANTLCNKPLFGIIELLCLSMSTVDNILTFLWCCLSENFKNWLCLFERP